MGEGPRMYVLLLLRPQRDLKTYTIEKDSGSALRPASEHGSSDSGRSELSGNSLAEVKAYQQRALARLASLTAAEASDRDEGSSAASMAPSVRSATKNIEARLHKVEQDLLNERRRQALLRQYLKHKAAEGGLMPEEEPFVVSRRSEVSWIHMAS